MNLVLYPFGRYAVFLQCLSDELVVAALELLFYKDIRYANHQDVVLVAQ